MSSALSLMFSDKNLSNSTLATVGVESIPRYALSTTGTVLHREATLGLEGVVNCERRTFLNSAMLQSTRMELVRHKLRPQVYRFEQGGPSRMTLPRFRTWPDSDQ